MKTILMLSLLFSSSIFAKTINNPKIIIKTEAVGGELKEKLSFSCDSDLDLVCKKINPDFTGVVDFSCAIKKLNKFTNAVSSIFSSIGIGECNGDNCQFVQEPGKQVNLYNLQINNRETKIETYMLRNNYWEKEFGESDEPKYISKIECE